MSLGQHHEKGQALPLAVLALLVLMAVVALVLDGGYAYAQRRHMQNAADAGVLAGAIVIAKGEYRDAVVRQVVNQYAQANKAASSQLTYLDANGNPLPNPTNGVVPAATAALRVTAQRTFPTYFAGLIGLPTMTASAQAIARAVPGAMPNEMQGLAPLSVPTNFYDDCARINAHCDLWDSSYARAWGIPPNQYKALVDLSQGTASGSMPQNVSDWTYAGYPGIINVDTWLPTISGNYGNNVADSLRRRILEHPGGVDPDGVLWGTIDIAIWDNFQPATSEEPMRVKVRKFGRFKIRLSDVYGSHTYGYFIDFVVPGHERGEESPAGPTLIILGG